MSEEVKKPFESEYGQGDIILLSSDGKRTECHISYLCVFPALSLCTRLRRPDTSSSSSSLFKSMFESSSANNEKPEVQMAESQKHLGALIPYCYPQRQIPTFLKWNSADLRSLFLSADKLDLLRAIEAIERVMMQR